MKVLGKWLPLLGFKGSKDYWKKRYELGGDSGAGSGGKAAEYKAEVVNRFVTDQGIRSVIEFGSGDGRQLLLARYEKYLGFDISDNALQRCREFFAEDASKRFVAMREYAGERAELAMSLDVLFHLVEDEVYFGYLDRLFAAAERYVVVYSTSIDAAPSSFRHVRHRPVERDIALRFPSFERMSEYEGELPMPVERGGGGPTKFMMYSAVRLQRG